MTKLYAIGIPQPEPDEYGMVYGPSSLELCKGHLDDFEGGVILDLSTGAPYEEEPAHTTNKLYNPNDWWCWNEPIWHPNAGETGEVIGNELRWRTSADIVKAMRIYFPNRALYKDPEEALIDFVIVNWAWRVNWPVRNHPGE